MYTDHYGTRKEDLFTWKQMQQIVELTRKATLADPNGPLPPLPPIAITVSYGHSVTKFGTVTVLYLDDDLETPETNENGLYKDYWQPKKLNLLQRIIGLIKARNNYKK